MSDKKIYVILAQTENVDIRANTKGAVTEEEAEAGANEVLFLEDGDIEYKPYILVPVCTEEEWRVGKVNFCPRCGAKLEEGTDGLGDFECSDCETSGNITLDVSYGF